MRITKNRLRKIIRESLTPLFQNKFGKIEIYYRGPEIGYGDYVRGPEARGLTIQIHAEGEDTPLPSNLIGYQGIDAYGNMTQYNIDPSLNITDRSNKMPMKVIYDTEGPDGTTHSKWGEVPEWDDIPEILKDLTGITIPADWFDAAGEELDDYAADLESQAEEDPEDFSSDSPIMVLIRMIDGTWHSHIM